MNRLSEIGTRLRLLRKGKMLRQSDVADALHISRANYAKMESGELDLRTGYCILLAEYYGVTCDYILRGVEAENVDFCNSTGLLQETIDTLQDYNDDSYIKEYCDVPEDVILREKCVFATKRFLINALLMDNDFLFDVASPAEDALWHDLSSQTVKVNQFAATEAFTCFFKKFINSAALKKAVSDYQNSWE